MKNALSRYLRYLIVSASMLTLNIGVASDATFNHPKVRLSGHAPSKATSEATFLGSFTAEESLPVTFTLPLRNQEALEQLIQRIYDPTDKQHYGKFLTPEEFTERFAPTQADYDKVIAYAKSQGLNITSTHPNRLLLNAHGPSKDIEKAFNIKLNMYQNKNDRKFYAADSAPEVPSGISAVISGIVGLDNAAVWHPHNMRGAIHKELSSSSSASFPSGPGGGFSPHDIKTAYNLNGISANGAGQNVALFQLGSYLESDIITYATYFGLPTPQLTNVIVDGGTSTIIDEVTLDIQLVLALAPASHIYVYEGPNTNSGVLNTYNRIATDNIAKQVSSSWGLGEDLAGSQIIQAENAIFQQMAAQGQTIYAAAGDSGAYDDYPNTNVMVDDPASQPYVVGVGGTSLTVNSTTGAYVSETVWNNGLGQGAGGGGVSAVWPIPSWQKNVSTTHSKTNRNVPDVSLNSDQNKAYAIYSQGNWNLFGGTSCAAPLWAGFTALVNQQREAAQMSTLGFANPTFYNLASTQPSDYHDITTGDNLVYHAAAGYDNATGWGSFNGGNLFASLTQSVVTTLPVVNITEPTNNTTVKGTLNVTATATSNTGIAHVDFYVDSALKTSDTSSPYSMSLNTTTLSNGLHTIKVIAYDGLGNTASNTVTITVNNANTSNVYINAGGSALQDPCTGIFWQADQYFSGAGGTTTNPDLAECLGIYASEHWGNMTYKIPVSNGAKYVVLKFAEIDFNAPGKRLFHVNINGQRVISYLDIYNSVGFGMPLDFTFPVNVVTGYVTIQFIPVVQNPKVSGIEIIPR